MKCIDCAYRIGGLRGVCTNANSDNYSDYVDEKLDCKDAKSKCMCGSCNYMLKCKKQGKWKDCEINKKLVRLEEEENGN